MNAKVDSVLLIGTCSGIVSTLSFLFGSFIHVTVTGVAFGLAITIVVWNTLPGFKLLKLIGIIAISVLAYFLAWELGQAQGDHIPELAKGTIGRFTICGFAGSSTLSMGLSRVLGWKEKNRVFIWIVGVGTGAGLLCALILCIPMGGSFMLGLFALWFGMMLWQALTLTSLLPLLHSASAGSNTADAGS